MKEAKKMRVLIACEYSGATRRAFEKRWGDLVEVVSCDLLPADDGAANHYQGDVLNLIAASRGEFRVGLGGVSFGAALWLSLRGREAKPFDFMLGHPPSTYLTNSGVGWLWKKSGNVKVWNEERYQQVKEGAEFFKALAEADIPFIALENPIMHKYAVALVGRKADQTIQPYQFGHPESKATQLWLKNLPKLVETHNVKEQWKALPKAEAQRLHWVSPKGKDGVPRWKIRSETYAGIAAAIADQLGGHALARLGLIEGRKAA